MKQLYFPFFLSFLLHILLFQCSKTLVHAQAPAPAPVPPLAPPLAPASAPPLAPPLVPPLAPPLVPPLAPAGGPAPSGPTNVTKILEKAGEFTTLIHLLKTTQVGDRINSWLNDSSQRFTLLAPTDDAFSTLKSGTLNSLTDEEKTELTLFHVLPTYLPRSQFQTMSNPVRTQAGDNSYYQFPLNVTTSGKSVNIATGINKASVGSTVYTDNQLAVYEVDHVLLPMNVFGPKPPPPPPPPPKPKKESPTAPVSVLPVSSSDGVGGAIAALGVAILVALSL